MTWNVGLILKPHSCLPLLRGGSSKSHYAAHGRIFHLEGYHSEVSGVDGGSVSFASIDKAVWVMENLAYLCLSCRRAALCTLFSVCPFHVWLGPWDVTRSAVMLTLFRVGDTLGMSVGLATPIPRVDPWDMHVEVTVIPGNVSGTIS